MEATHKKGFFKGKLAKSFSRITKARPTTGSATTSSKVVPCSTPSSTSTYSSIPRVSTYSYANLPSSVQKVSYASFKPHNTQDQIGYAIETWGHADENVDFKASSYISNVRERFKLDRV